MASLGFPGQQSFFYNGGTFKISSVIDGSVLDVQHGAAKEGAHIISYDWSGSQNQRFVAVSEGNGYRIESKVPAKQGKVVFDLNGGNQTVALYGFHGGPNQQWVAEPIPNGDGAVVITNLFSGTCLRHIGHGKQVKCSPKAWEDRGIWWYLTAA